MKGNSTFKIFAGEPAVTGKCHYYPDHYYPESPVSIHSGIPGVSKLSICQDFEASALYGGQQRPEGHKECIICRYWEGCSVEEAFAKFKRFNQKHNGVEKTPEPVQKPAKAFNRFAEIDIVM
jgi:hypothetical protein